MTDDRRRTEALFRHSVLGSVLSRELRRGELRPALAELAQRDWTGPDGGPRRFSWRTLEEWYYRYRREGFDGLLPRPRSDEGSSRALTPELQLLVLSMKREDPGRSAPLILHELQEAGRLKRGQVSVSAIQRLLRRNSLSGPKLELDRPERLRWRAEVAGELWQGDALHGPKLRDPATGRELRAKVFGLIDDRSRLLVHARAGFHETQEAFLKVLLRAVQRRGVPRNLLLDNHKSFTGADVQVACAKLGIRLRYARPYDGPAKGKIERFWRTLRGRCLDRLDPAQVTTLDALNVRVGAWIEADYNQRGHSGLGGRTPQEVWEEEAHEVRFLDDPQLLEAAFTAELKRKVRNDSTCQVRGRTYEAPTHLRGQQIVVCYSLLRPALLYLRDGEVRVPLREVDPVANAERSRGGGVSPAAEPPKPTGLNAVEDLLRRLTRPLGQGRAEEDHRDA
jgi:putative transposase